MGASYLVKKASKLNDDDLPDASSYEMSEALSEGGYDPASKRKDQEFRDNKNMSRKIQTC